MTVITCDIRVESAIWDKKFPDYPAQVQRCLNQIETLSNSESDFDLQGAEVSILLCDDRMIRTLNRDYRGVDKPTNVLAFPAFSADDIRASALPPVLGDVVFAYETIQAEAEAQEKSFTDHFCHLCLHGFLHLLGHDHDVDADRIVMETLEKRLLAKLSIDDPYRD